MDTMSGINIWTNVLDSPKKKTAFKTDAAQHFLVMEIISVLLQSYQNEAPGLTPVVYL